MNETFYNLYWGDSLLLGNFRDSSDLLNEIADRMDNEEIHAKWLFPHVIAIGRELRKSDNGVLLIGITQPKLFGSGKFQEVIPARGYSILWETRQS